MVRHEAHQRVGLILGGNRDDVPQRELVKDVVSEEILVVGGKLDFKKFQLVALRKLLHQSLYVHVHVIVNLFDKTRLNFQNDSIFEGYLLEVGETFLIALLTLDYVLSQDKRAYDYQYFIQNAIH